MVDWTNVLVALIAGLPAIISAVAALKIHAQIKTPSGTSIGKQVEGAQHTALANHYLLRATANEVGVPTPASAQREAGKVAEIEPDGGE